MTQDVRHDTARRAPAVLTALLLSGLLTGCAGTSPDATRPSTIATTTPAPSAAATTSAPAAVPSSPASTAAEVTEVSLVLADGDVTGDTPLARLTVGQPVRLTVTSDVADELHVHGVDETAELEPGEPAVLEFTPESPGRFEVELHEARRVLTRLQVR